LRTEDGCELRLRLIDGIVKREGGVNFKGCDDGARNRNEQGNRKNGARGIGVGRLQMSKSCIGRPALPIDVRVWLPHA
jgi:hypothetical protein